MTTKKQTIPMSLSTTKDTTKAIETRAGIMKDAPGGPAGHALPKAKVYLQYLGTEIDTDEMLKRVKKIWTRDMGRDVLEIKSIHLYMKPEEFAAYYVINEETTGRIDW